MTTSSSKENILKKIRQALSNPVPVPFPGSEGNNSVFQPPADDLEVLFAQEFTKLLGKFAYALNGKDMIAQIELLLAEKKWTKVFCSDPELVKKFAGTTISTYFMTDIAGCDVSITGCEYLIARTGTVVLSSAQQDGRTASVYAPVHICVAYISQLIYDIKDGLMGLKEKYQGKLPSMVSFATGPSRTADIEKTLVVGVHGPKEAYVFLVDKF